MRDERLKTKVGAKDVGSERKRKRGRRKRRMRTDPGVREYWAPPRRVGPTPTIPRHQRTDSHRVHTALTYIQPAFTTGETACRSNKRGPGHARWSQPTTCESRSLPTFCEVARTRYSFASDLADERYDLGPDREIVTEDRSHLRELY